MKKSFLLLFLIVCLPAGVVLFLPQLPQEDLQNRLTVKFEQMLQQPCQIDEVNLQLFPHPAVIVHGFESVTAALNIKSRTLSLEFSYASLLKLSPEITGASLQGMFIETPFTALFKPVSDQSQTTSETNSISKSLVDLIAMVSSPEQNLCYINLLNVNLNLTEVPGLDEPLDVTAIAGHWQCSARNLSETLELSGVVAGGRGDLGMTWYQVGKSGAEGGKPLDDSINRLEVSGHLDAVSLPVYEIVPAAFPDKRLRAGFARGFLEFDINGDPEAGLRFSGKVAVDNHKFTIYDTESDSEKIYSRGEAKLSLGGFFQRHDSYINIKSAALEFPGAATLFSRGLIRFNEPLFVDLVNELKIDDIGLLGRNIPVLKLPGYQVAGQLGGELKLVGNPVSAPVLQVNLKSDLIALRKDVTTPDTHPDDDGLRADSTDNQAVKLENQAVQLLKSIAKWEWLIKSDCQIKSMKLPELTITDISLQAEKSLMELEIERLAARFGKSGQLRLSLILKNLLHDPHWQASLIADKLNLKPFRKTFSMAGILDASLVGSGLLDSDSGLSSDLDLNGKWRLRQGTFVNLSVFRAFTRFIDLKKQIQLGATFKDFSGKFALRDKILRLNQMKLRSAGSQVNAGGRFFTDSERLKFKGQFISKTSSPTPFNLSGDLRNPLFQ